MSASLTITGGDALRGQLLGLAAKVKPAIAAALVQEGETIRRESQARVPVDLGTLKNSAYVAPPVIAGDRVSVEIGYGGAAAAYAEPVHERLHDRHPNGGGPKYLESVINEHEAGFSERIGARVAEDLGL
jgi:hypothetical protein